jgi:hypothetical protein
VIIGYGTPPEHGYRAAVDALLRVFADVGLAKKREREPAIV